MRTYRLSDRIRLSLILSFFFIFSGNSLFAQNFSDSTLAQQTLDEKCAATYIEKKQTGKLGIYGTREYFEFWVEDKKQALRQQPYALRAQAGETRKIRLIPLP